MATILPFKPIRPNPFYAGQLVFTKPQAESVAGESIQPLKTLLEAGARLRPETPEGQALAYMDIKESLQNLLEKDYLWREEIPGIFIYEVVHKHYRQTGVWALTDVKDYNDGRIKIHELTFADSVRRLKNYRENTGLEGSPVLLTYAPTIAINRIIAETKASPEKAALGNEHGLHKIWKIKDGRAQEALIKAFAEIGTVYLADGHHRIESAALSGFEHISSLYMATDQLRIEEYDRVVIPEHTINMTNLFGYLQKFFYLRESTGNQPVRPRQRGNFGILFEGYWYHMLTKTAKGMLPDAAILQELVLAPFFGIDDPKTDSRLKCAGGEKALEEISALLLAHPGAIAFTLCPLTVGELMEAAGAGLILPPKSTWIVPKVPYGLLIYQHERN